MDINFHYFAVRTLAHFAGFSAYEAQRIAEFSEYIDDYDWYSYINCTNIPEYARYEEYDLVVNAPLIGERFNPAQTGFSDWFDYAILLLERNQKFIVSPFHFVPKNKASANKHNRTTPLVPNDQSMIDGLLWQVIENYLDCAQQGLPTDTVLMRLGMLLHTYADTYAHQLFSGYNSWVNEVKVTRVINNIDGSDLTEAFQANIEEANDKFAAENDGITVIPAIGHARAGHTPDLTNISFDMQYKSGQHSGYDREYRRSNTQAFVTASRYIINYLGKCFNRPDVSDYEWGRLSPRLTEAFLVEMPKKNVAQTLATHWGNVFPEVKPYFFEKNIIEDRFKIGSTNNYTEEFYRFNCMADRELIELYGYAPRR